MADANETEVKDEEGTIPAIEPSEAAEAGSESSSEEEGAKGTEGESDDTDEGGEADDDGTNEPDEVHGRKKPDVKIELSPADSKNPTIRLPGETDKEYAFRQEIHRLRTKDRNNNFVEGSSPEQNRTTVKVPSEILAKYKPEELNNLREVLPELAKELGFVKKDELEQGTYTEKANDEVAKFISQHPEYSPENDPDSILWDRLKAEYNAFYKNPKDPKDFGKIFNRIHQDIMGIKTSGPSLQTNAAREKIKVASHTGGSSRTAVRSTTSKAPSGLRTDMLKGFDDDDIADIEKRAAE